MTTVEADAEVMAAPETVPAPDPVLAIAANDSLVHAGRSDRVARHWFERPAAPPKPPVEFYDAAGRVLTLVDPTDASPAGFTREAGAPPATVDAQQLLADRIVVALAKAQVERDKERADPQGDTGAGPARLPLFTGGLEQVVTALAALDDALSHDDPDAGGWLHNLMHRAFG